MVITEICSSVMMVCGMFFARGTCSLRGEVFHKRYLFSIYRCGILKFERKLDDTKKKNGPWYVRCL